MSQVATLPKRSLVDSMAAKYDMEPAAFVNAIKATVIKGDCSNEQFAAFLMVAKEYDLNPLTKEIYAFPDRGGITPIVSIDGWMNLINSHPQFDGMEFTDTTGDDGKLYSVECRMYRKDRARPVSVIEYMSECFRQTDPWKKWPNRMLRHKAAIQCARYAFGFSGIMEPDEYERMKDVTPAAQPTVMDRLKAARNITPATQEAADEQEGFSRSFVAEQTEEPLTGDIIEQEIAGEDIPAQPADDAAPIPAIAASTEGDGIAAQSSSPSNPLPSELRQHLMDFARNASKIVEDTSLTDDGKTKTIEKMVLNYQDVIDQADWGKISAITVPLQAVFAGKRTMQQARKFIAGDLLDCDVTEIGG